MAAGPLMAGRPAPRWRARQAAGAPGFRPAHARPLLSLPPSRFVGASASARSGGVVFDGGLVRAARGAPHRRRRVPLPWPAQVVFGRGDGGGAGRAGRAPGRRGSPAARAAARHPSASRGDGQRRKAAEDGGAKKQAHDAPRRSPKRARQPGARGKEKPADARHDAPARPPPWDAPLKAWGARLSAMLGGRGGPELMGYALPQLQAPERYRYRAAGVVLYDFHGPGGSLRVLLHRKHVVTKSDIVDGEYVRRGPDGAPLASDVVKDREVWNILGGKRKVTDLCVEDTASREVWEETGGLVHHEMLREALLQPQAAGVIWYPNGWYVLYLHRLGSAKGVLKSHVHEVGGGDLPTTFESVRQGMADGSLTERQQAQIGIPDDGQETSELHWVPLLDLELGGRNNPHHVFLRGVLRTTQLLPRLRLEEEVHHGMRAGEDAALAISAKNHAKARAHAKERAKGGGRAGEQQPHPHPSPASASLSGVGSVREAVNLALIAQVSESDAAPPRPAEPLGHVGAPAHGGRTAQPKYFCPKCGVATQSASAFERHLRGQQHERVVAVPFRLRYMIEGWFATDHRASDLLKRTLDSEGYLPVSALLQYDIAPFVMFPKHRRLNVDTMVRELALSPLLEVDVERKAVRAACSYTFDDRRSAGWCAGEYMRGRLPADARGPRLAAEAGGSGDSGGGDVGAAEAAQPPAPTQPSRKPRGKRGVKRGRPQRRLRRGEGGDRQSKGS